MQFFPNNSLVVCFVNLKNNSSKNTKKRRYQPQTDMMETKHLHTHTGYVTHTTIDFSIDNNTVVVINHFD
jgi:hypothetical protein